MAAILSRKSSSAPRFSLELAAALVLCAVLGSSLFPSMAAEAPDYTFLWWAHGWRGASVDGHKVLHLQTNHFGAAIDTESATVRRLGEIEKPFPYSEAVSQSNEVITQLPEAHLELAVAVDGVRYVCTSAAGSKKDESQYPVRIIESGRFLQRADIAQLVFEESGGMRLAAQGRLEIVGWPDRLSWILEITPEQDLQPTQLEMRLKVSTGPIVQQTAAAVLPAGKPAVCSLTWTPPSESQAPSESAVVRVRDVGAELPVRWDALHDWWYADLPEQTWAGGDDPDRLDRFPVEIENPSDQPITLPIVFAFDAPFSGVIGLSPMLRDAQGRPTGLPVQISKNWHRQPNKPLLYEGPWFHGATMLRLAPHERWSGEFALAYARWGGVPAASHAQLCLIGWGTNQLWEQAAIGSWGESICYDPDVNLNRSMIDDVRPLMVTGMNSSQWEWTCNVGGGDFLVYFDSAGQKQYLSRMRTAYLGYGPNLTDVIYAGVTPDGCIEARIEVSSPRCDDINRAFHHVRYEVRKATPFSRLAFYQLGADNYNDHTFRSIARGNADGLVEEWNTERGGKRYLRTGLAMEGAAPWISLHGGERNEAHKQGAWANRGLVVRSWKARLGGKDAPQPFAAVYGTENGVPSANAEIVPPPGVTALEPGDFVDAEFEWLTLPQHAEDYYGPNSALRADLAAHGDTWEPVLRQAKGNEIEVRGIRGTVEHRYPIVVRAEAGGAAEFEVRGGLGYVPLKITGLGQASGSRLRCVQDEQTVTVDQSVHGNDFWQVGRGEDGSYSIVYNIPLDTPGDAPVIRRFIFQAQPG